LTSTTGIRVNNVFNEFLMLSNNQFIENRVYEDDETSIPTKEDDKNPVDLASSPEQMEAILMPKYTEAIGLGIEVLLAFAIESEETEQPEDEGAEQKEATEVKKKPKSAIDELVDIYSKNPLPAIIGTKQFNEDEYCGLAIQAEEEEPEPELQLQNKNRAKKRRRMKRMMMSSLMMSQKTKTRKLDRNQALPERLSQRRIVTKKRKKKKRIPERLLYLISMLN